MKEGKGSKKRKKERKKKGVGRKKKNMRVRKVILNIIRWEKKERKEVKTETRTLIAGTDFA